MTEGEMTERSAHEAGHYVAAEHFGRYPDVTFRADGLPGAVVHVTGTPRQEAVIAIAGCVASSEGSMDKAMATLSDADVRNTAPWLLRDDGSVDDNRLMDALLDAMAIIRERWPRVLELAARWDANANV